MFTGTMITTVSFLQMTLHGNEQNGNQVESTLKECRKITMMMDHVVNNNESSSDCPTTLL